MEPGDPMMMLMSIVIADDHPDEGPGGGAKTWPTPASERTSPRKLQILSPISNRPVAIGRPTGSDPALLIKACTH
jgi:hypothetical protein